MSDLCLYCGRTLPQVRLPVLPTRLRKVKSAQSKTSWCWRSLSHSAYTLKLFFINSVFDLCRRVQFGTLLRRSSTSALFVSWSVSAFAINVVSDYSTLSLLLHLLMLPFFTRWVARIRLYWIIFDADCRTCWIKHHTVMLVGGINQRETVSGTDMSE